MKTENVVATPVSTLLEQHALFRGMAKHHLDLLGQVAMIKEFAAGDVIFREGDPANRFYLILDGEVSIEDPRRDSEPAVVQTVGPNDVLGWSWLFPPYYWHFDARATKPTKALFFYGTWLRENCERSPEFGYEMMKRMASVLIERLQSTRRKLVAAQGTPAGCN